ncbi:MAG: hypothetical protein IJ726_01975 [Phocaeicola sp.]|nr:hypothetical protein [Phocaeicola sp.]
MNTIGRKINKEIIKNASISFLLAFVFILVFSTSTTILGTSFSLDSAIFQLIGKYWKEGVIPYTGLWDSKGPMIYFINALGYFLTNSNTGVFLIQIISLSITIYYIYSFFRLNFTEKTSWLLSLIALLGLSNCYESGNLVEEYLLPILVSSFFYMYKWTDTAFVKKDYNHSLFFAFLYGLVLAFSLLTRLTNAIGVCIGVFIIVLTLLLTRNWKNLFLCALSFVCGFCTLVLPFFVYFYFNDALYDMWYGSVLYNIEYASSSSKTAYESLYALLSHLLAYSNNFFLFFISVGVVCFNKERRLIGFFWLCVSCITYLYFCFTFRYSHYSIITLPYFCIGIIELKIILDSSKNILIKKTGYFLLNSFVFFIIVGSSFQVYQVVTSEKDELSDYKSILSEIPERDMVSFVGYNTEAYFYLKLNMKPCYRFFCIQDWISSNGASILPILKETFEKGDAKWILVKTYGDICGIQNILDQRYLLYDKKNDLLLYRLK